MIEQWASPVAVLFNLLGKDSHFSGCFNLKGLLIDNVCPIWAQHRDRHLSR